MKPVKIKDANADYAKPADWDEKTMGPCGTLPIRREVEGTPGSGAYLSLKSNWKPTDAELAILNAGGVVELECCGVQPAVSITAVPCADESVDQTTNFVRLQKARDVAVSPGNYDVCEYMHGMANGIIFAEATLKGETPTYLPQPKEWLRK